MLGKGARSRIVPKDVRAASEALGESWHNIKLAKQQMDKARKAIGQNSKWQGEMSKIYKQLYSCQLLIEDMREEMLGQ